MFNHLCMHNKLTCVRCEAVRMPGSVRICAVGLPWISVRGPRGNLRMCACVGVCGWVGVCSRMGVYVSLC